MRILLLVIWLIKSRQSIRVRARRQATLRIVWRRILPTRACLDRRVGGGCNDLAKDGREPTCYLFIRRAQILIIHLWYFLVGLLVLVTVAHLGVVE